ncbi:MAG: hypothetical protein MR802_07195 [Prevotella sp.]|nr:hypothetical protein [Prevotella sp.]
MKTILIGNNYYIRTMKKYILPLMSIAMLMSMASCSSSDDAVEEIKEESKLVPMTFTATQESNAGTRAALSTGNSVIWQTSDKISVFDGYNDTDHNRSFTLEGDGGETSGSFTGTASSEATTFTAVYPYTEGATLGEDGSVSGITLPAVQTAYKDSFDPKAALMMAVSTKDKKYNLDFKNAVTLVKIQTKFACKKIVLSANEDIAGTGTLNYNTDAPSISLDSDQSKTVTLKPALEYGAIAAGTYYIAICPQTLTGFSISFINSTDTKVYTRTSTKNNIFNRREIKNLGTFSESGTSWTSTMESNGKVNASQQVDMVEFTIGDKKYRVIFATSNLTATGLAASESDYGDYFAWGATEPWYTSYTTGTNGSGKPTITSDGWKDGHESGYRGTPTFSPEYTSKKDFDMSDDPARKILGGDWQLPTTEIWKALYNTKSYSWDWTTKDSKNGRVVKNKSTNYSIFLPAAGYVASDLFFSVGLYGHYWSGTANSIDSAYSMYFYNDDVRAQDPYYLREIGLSVRPVRLVEVSLAGSDPVATPTATIEDLENDETLEW